MPTPQNKVEGWEERFDKECFCTEHSLLHPATFSCKYDKTAIKSFIRNLLLTQSKAQERETVLIFSHNLFEMYRVGLDEEADNLLIKNEKAYQKEIKALTPTDTTHKTNALKEVGAKYGNAIKKLGEDNPTIKGNNT